MDQLIKESLFNNSPCGFALLKLKIESDKIYHDSIFIENNQLFLKITTNSLTDINKIKGSVFFHHKLDDYNHWQQILANIVLTTNVIADDKEQCLASGMDDFLTKPIIKNTLIKVIKKYLGQE